MSRSEYVVALVFALAIARCDGTLTGIGRVPRPPEPSLPAAPVESVTSSNADPSAPGVARADQPVEIVAQHLLIMYDGSKGAPRTIKRTRDEARTRAVEALAKVKKGEDFDKIVVAYTDEPGGAERRGDLGRFSHDMMVKPFADAAFALDVGQVSGVIESPFGFHVIRRTE